MHRIRRARIPDATAIAGLMAQLGYAASPALIEEKLALFADDPNDAVFVAEAENQLAGVVSCHITRLFHQHGNLGRITSFVVDEQNRGVGVGRQLIGAAESFFRDAGCVRAEVTSGDHRSDAHAFYVACGFRVDERRFVKAYS